VVVKSFNIKELFRFAGCVVEKFLVEKVGVQVAMLRDCRCKPRCPDCRVTLKEVRAGKIAVYDLPLAVSVLPSASCRKRRRCATYDVYDYAVFLACWRGRNFSA
jgi:hypothetical protein